MNCKQLYSNILKQPFDNARYAVWTLFLLLVLIWGSSFILIKNGLAGYTAWQAATIRLVPASSVMFFLAIRDIRKVPRQKIPFILLVGTLSMLFPAYLFSIAETNINSAMAGILNALTPLFTGVFAISFWGQNLSKKQWLGLGIGFFSTSFLLLFNTDARFTFNEYALLIVLATACYGLNINIVKNYLSDINPLHVTTIAVSFAGVMGFIFLFASGYENYVTVNKSQFYPLLSLIILGVIHTALAQLMQNRLIQKSSVAFVSSTTYLIPVVAVLIGLLVGEQLVFLHYISMAGIIFSVWIIKE